MANTPLAFVSYDIKLSEDDRVRFVNEMDLCPSTFRVDDWSAERKASREDWANHVHSKIGRTDFMIVLVADGMDLEKASVEIAEARRCNVPFFGVYVGGAKEGVPLPEGLGRKRTIPWDWDRIGAAVRQVNTEGKHHIFR